MVSLCRMYSYGKAMQEQHIRRFDSDHPALLYKLNLPGYVNLLTSILAGKGSPKWSLWVASRRKPEARLSDQLIQIRERVS